MATHVVCDSEDLHCAMLALLPHVAHGYRAKGQMSQSQLSVTLKEV